MVYEEPKFKAIGFYQSKQKIKSLMNISGFNKLATYF